MLRAARLPDEYALEEMLHRGHASEVWKAQGPGGKLVAVKLALSGATASRERFATEARCLAALTHRSVVRMHGHGESLDGRPFLALEWLDGQSVTGLLTERGGSGLPPRDAVRLLLPIALALVVAHDRGIVHGDVSADHVMLVHPDPETILPKLVDFGAARRIMPTIPPPRPSEPTVRIVEPPHGGDPAVDVRGFASTIFHAIAGRRPFTDRASGPSVPRTGLSERDAALWRILAEGLAPGAVHSPTMHDFARDLAIWADLRGLDTDITGTPVLGRWLESVRSVTERPRAGGLGHKP